ncbi:MFS transporter [Propionibacteriaceae bacterium G1746]|uniref:MFS transporter n=1 Tax=Aestuariimicrobium sp. G57 TaxID=3418485 RepID=UPI003C246CA8
MHLPTTTALEAAPPTSRRRIIAWAMWDWGTQPFNTVITTFVFAVYITSSSFGATNDTSQALATSTTIAGIIVALLAPVLGQQADRSGHTVFHLRWQTWLLALISMSLFFIAPSPDYLVAGLVLLGLGSIISDLAGVNYNSTIAQVADSKNIGRVSGFGWGMGYLGGIVVLLLIYAMFIAPGTLDDGLDIRYSMIVCGLWTLLFTIPTFLVIRDRPRAGARPPRAGIIESYRLLGGTIKRLWVEQRDTFWFLLASALFRDGLVGVFAFGAVIAQGTFGFGAGEVIIFGAAANIVAGLSTIAFGLLDDRIGPRAVILMSLIALVVCGIGVYVAHDAGKTVFWVLGLVMCMFVGPAQSASRSFLSRLIPEGRTGEIFGLYATTGRAVSFLSPAMFGLAIAAGEILTGQQNTQYWGILGIVAVLVAGLVAMLFVKDHRHHSTIA